MSSWVRRSGELGVRIRDLHERNAQLSAGFGPPDLTDHRAVGSTPDQAAKARALARTASLRALESLQRMAMMRVHAASAHDRAARLHELLAEAGHGDIAEHRERRRYTGGRPARIVPPRTESSAPRTLSRSSQGIVDVRR